MQYFKNTELAELYHVSEKSVRNWIDAADTEKLPLKLLEVGGKKYIANTAKNTSIVEQLVEKGKKYKNSRGYKVLRPSSKFYKLYSLKQVTDIITNIDTYREIPVQYTYFNSGAKRWDIYTKHLLNDDESNALTNTVGLLETNFDYIDNIVENAHVNIIDLGVGNALPVRNLIEHFQKRGNLRRYIGIDISSELLDIAEHNIDTWFNKKVHFERYVRDLVYDRFDDLLVNDFFNTNAESTINIVLFLGGTLSNFREPFHALSTIHGSMGKNDLLFFSKKLDTQRARRFFDLASPGNQAIELVLELLNIDKSLYSLEQTFDEQRMVREVYAKLNVALQLKFKLDDKEKTVELNKGEGILLWRAKHQNMLEVFNQFNASGFDLLQATRSKDQTYLLTISKIRTVD